MGAATDTTIMKGRADPLPDLIPVPLKGAVLLLPHAEYLAGIHRGKWWRRREAMEWRETTSEPSPVVASGGEPDKGS